MTNSVVPPSFLDILLMYGIVMYLIKKRGIINQTSMKSEAVIWITLDFTKCLPAFLIWMRKVKMWRKKKKNSNLYYTVLSTPRLSSFTHPKDGVSVIFEYLRLSLCN